MKTYKFTCTETRDHTLEVGAESEEEARAIMSKTPLADWQDEGGDDGLDDIYCEVVFDDDDYEEVDDPIFGIVLQPKQC